MWKSEPNVLIQSRDANESVTPRLPMLQSELLSSRQPQKSNEPFYLIQSLIESDPPIKKQTSN